jgi:hypothetical protein
VLGSCVGSLAPRAAFLQSKIEEQERTLARLPGLPHQHALLVLRECLQQNLRHLLRSLRSDDLGHLWTRYDASLQRCVLQMQGANLDRAERGPDAPQAMLRVDTFTQGQPSIPEPLEHLESSRVHQASLPEVSQPVPGPFLENRTLDTSSGLIHATQGVLDTASPVLCHVSASDRPEQLGSSQGGQSEGGQAVSLSPEQYLENRTLDTSSGLIHASIGVLSVDIPALGQSNIPGPSEHLGPPLVDHTNLLEGRSPFPGPISENSTSHSSSDHAHAQETRLSTSDKPSQLISLPAKLGGLGILSMLECAPLAYAAASEASDRTLQPLLMIRPSEQQLTADALTLDTLDTLDKAPVRSQKDRCTEVFEARHKHLLSTLSPPEVQAIQESATYLGRRWLSIIPFHPSLKLSDFELSAALHHRTLSPSHRTYCHHCGLRNEIMHDEVCPARPKWRIARHEQLKHTLANALARSPSLGKVRIEPFVAGTHLRTDISISGSQLSGTGPQEFDLTILSLASSQFRSTDPAKNTLQQVLSRAAQAKINKYAARTASKFVPLVFSLGGAMEKQCSSTLHSWRDHMPLGSHSFLLKRISILLLRARFRFFEA